MRCIFIVEHEPYKRGRIMGVMAHLFPRTQLVPCESTNECMRYLHTTFREIVETRPQECLIVSGMRLPHIRGAKLYNSGGIHLFNDLTSEATAVPAVIISTNKMANDDNANAAYGFYAGSVTYSKYDEILHKCVDLFDNTVCNAEWLKQHYDG